MKGGVEDELRVATYCRVGDYGIRVGIIIQCRGLRVAVHCLGLMSDAWFDVFLHLRTTGCFGGSCTFAALN